MSRAPLTCRGSAVACLIGENVLTIPGMSPEVRMWVYEEVLTSAPYEGQKLSEIINTKHENVKYLPGITLPSNIVAVTDLATAVEGATLLVFVLPHQFLPRLFADIRKGVGGESVLTSGKVKAISLIKGEWCCSVVTLQRCLLFQPFPTFIIITTVKHIYMINLLS